MEIEDFPEFFALVNDGAMPFVWQRELVESVSRSQQWPDTISAPTGAGKSAVIEAHVFLTAWAAQKGVRVPRRLAIVVGRRALVDSHNSRADHIANQLSAASGGLLKEVADALHTLDPHAEHALLVTALRGALAPQRGWVDEPAACQIICATPDMWGSRLLFGGYGSRREAAPREAGLIALDSVAVIDEAHLNRQLLFTARRVAQLAAPSGGVLGIPSLQVVAMTATPAEASAGRTMGVTAQSLNADAMLAQRLSAPKTVRIATSASWHPKGRASAAHVDLLCDEVMRLRAEHSGTIGCVVNRVDTAVRIADKLKKGGLTVELWVGRLRPMDASRLRRDNPELFDSRCSPRMDVLVATQTIEVGVDLDLPALVTELAPATSLVQRAGRVNRRGARPSGEFVVVQPAAIEDCPPYSGDDLQAGSDWIVQLAADSRGINASAVLESPPPLEGARRGQLMRPEVHDVMRWKSTSTRWLVKENLELWLRDDLTADAQAGLVLRGPLPDDDLSALELLRATPPDDAETFPVGIGLLREVVASVLDKPRSRPARAFFAREGEINQLNDLSSLAPGDVVLLDQGHPITKQGVVVSPTEGAAEYLDVRWGPEGRRVVFADSSDGFLLQTLAGLSLDDAATQFKETTGSFDNITLPAGLDADIDLPWIVRTPQPIVIENDEARQLEGASAAPSTLNDHQTAVAQEAERLALCCGLGPEVRSAQRLAGAHHDEGKRRPEFQRERLQNRNLSVPLAKSTVQNAQTNQRRPSSLPVGWRHEHLSVAIAAELIDPAQPQRDLTLRLIGTSHGHGRGVPRHCATELVGPDADVSVATAARTLFDEGGWNELLDATDAVFGPWGCAFLEAVLRAADCRISKEGR